MGFTSYLVTGVWMGNDDNTPLSGVTGGGLPAQIWREVMVRVEDGLPATPLPMITPDQLAPPAYPADAYSSADPYAPADPNAGLRPPQYPPSQDARRPDPIEMALRDVMNAILGRN